MSEIVFSQIGEHHDMTMTINSDVTWHELTDQFVAFLRGCGYQVTGADVADYMTEVFGSNIEQMEVYPYDEYPAESADVTLDDVMNMWGTTNVSTDTNTITITTK